MWFCCSFLCLVCIYCLLFIADIYDDVCSRIEPLGLDCECLGGGRILHVAADQKLEVYGYSMVSTLYYWPPHMYQRICDQRAGWC